ncbi:MAG: cytochrome c3 family protein [Nitrospinae bacterium]|nr:cytochrome c3 family protein [Nitrospinota bacterium]
MIFIVVSIGCKGVLSKTESIPEEEIDQSSGDFYLSHMPFYNKDNLFTKSLSRPMSDKEMSAKKREILSAMKARPDEGIAIYFSDPPKNPPLPRALRIMPKDKYGYPDWVKAVKIELIHPLSSLDPDEHEEKPLMLDIVFRINDRMMSDVVFPHDIHTYWSSCDNCHPSLFIMKKGANKMGMESIWKGKYCGHCHGTIAFPSQGFENCIRCHNLPQK